MSEKSKDVSFDIFDLAIKIVVCFKWKEILFYYITLNINCKSRGFIKLS